MNHFRVTLFILLISVFSVHCQTTTAKKSLKTLPPELIEVIEKRIADGVTPSMAIALIDSAGITYHNFGKTAKNGELVDEHTIYEIGSISKVFTGILLAQQVLDGDLNLEDEINDFLPNGIKAATMGEAEITFGHLTDHTSGFPRMPDNFDPANPNNPFADYTVDQMYAFISDYKPEREVGESYEYSNFAQGLLGHLLSLNKNNTYEALMVQTIADPLEMEDTRIRLTDRMKENLAPGHNGGEVVENWDIPTLAGAGAIRSSSSDMATFIAANLGYVESPLAEAMAFSHKVRHRKAGDMKVAMGWHIKNGEDGDVIWHNGGTGGYRAFAGFVKETGIGVVLLTNSSISSDDIGFHLLDPGSQLANIKSKNQAVNVPEATLEQYVGVYELAPEFKITITKEGKQLYLQATGQPRFEIYPENDTKFYLTVVEASISFQRKNGLVESLILFQGGQEMPGKKVE
ncbi:serine hydrolase [Cyclobacterium jeungdonense]|uniref:Beta-lactamase n=1 Tax=Cyclobacterium jeungdonense TaxID=708087 RepID=A0ABT8CFH0_9BACT|nr:serine hydrolase [Cyclobacterium jeungdonense]MDN3690421.1 serine hydrolase [Cyclobacterium jeungdonense]